jgi:hypothetical protein
MDMHPALQLVLVVGALASATAAVWRYWLSHLVSAIREATHAATQTVAILREMRDFLQATLPTIMHQFEDHETRITRVEHHVGIKQETTDKDGK